MELTGQFLTRATIWLSVVGYTLGSAIFALSGKRSRWDWLVRLVWTLAWASLIAHFISAFQFYHHWSHASAYIETARQTDEMFGINWGGGLFINYLLLLAWTVDIAWWWWRGVSSYRNRPSTLMAAWHWFLIFIIFNATVVFANGMVRWVGLAICLILSLCWLYIGRQRLIGKPLTT